MEIEELKKIALEKAKNGNATRRALAAQKTLYDLAQGNVIETHLSPMCGEYGGKRHTAIRYEGMED